MKKKTNLVDFSDSVNNVRSDCFKLSVANGRRIDAKFLVRRKHKHFNDSFYLQSLKFMNS